MVERSLTRSLSMWSLPRNSATVVHTLGWAFASPMSQFNVYVWLTPSEGTDHFHSVTSTLKQGRMLCIFRSAYLCAQIRRDASEDARRLSV